VALIIADVSGHGLLSAMVSSQLKLLFARYMSRTRSPGATLHRLNENLMRITRSEDYVTAFCALIDFREETMIYATAGHPEQLFCSNENQEIKRISSEGFLLGMFDDTDFFETPTAEIIPIKPGDRLMVLPDGVLEAMDPDRRPFGFDRWEEAFQSTLGDPPKVASARLVGRLQSHTKGSFQDDVAFVIVDLGEKVG